MNPATMTPEQLAEHGIPVIVALRARLEEAKVCHSAACLMSSDHDIEVRLRERIDTLRDALAILEAKAQ
jgi:hypothetical protein